MKNITRYIIGTGILLVVLFTVQAVQAQGIKERMKQRLPDIVELKEKGIVGENNKGYLSFRTGGTEAQKQLVNEENADRRTIYEYIAQKEGVPVEKVGARRAVQIAENAKPGEYLQDKDGNWYKKQ